MDEPLTIGRQGPDRPYVGFLFRCYSDPKIGSNLNQLAHVGNAGGVVDGAALAAALGDLTGVRVAILEALGRQVEP